MILPSLYILSYILSMATYLLDGKTARIFAEVKNARVSGQTKSLEREDETESETGPKGVWGSRAFRENLIPALRVFAKQIMKERKKKRLFSSLHS